MDQSPVQELDVHDGLESTLTVLQHKLKTSTSRGSMIATLPHITAYGSELNQVWTILLDNAADALAGKGSICVRTTLENQYLVVEIVDDGPGIPARTAIAPVRAVLHDQTCWSGDGIGLEYRAADRSRAASRMIHAVSHPGDTRFQVYLPLDG